MKYSKKILLFKYAPKKIGIAFCFILCILHFGFAQAPLVKMWDKRFGGTNSDIIFNFEQTADSGYILGGWSSSAISGDKTQASRGYDDYWLVKTDSIGNKQWDKRFGGNDYDELYSMHQTFDHGYIFGGLSYSGNNGDKSQPRWGGDDFWVVKTDSQGIKQWDKRFGGTDFDELFSLSQTADGGYILGGWSSSFISGDKTQNPRGTYDYWIVRVSPSGAKLWDRRYGGNDYDILYSILQTIDGGFLLSGSTSSGNNGDITQASAGGNDFWIVKCDSLGNKLWDKRFGGSGDDILSSSIQTNDGGYILAGYSNSGAGGDKTQNTWGANDYWIIKIDSAGNKQWDRDFGGTSEENELGNITQTSGNGYLIAGTSYSPIGGDKTENNLGGIQTWILKIDSAGNKEWDKTILTPGNDRAGFALQTNDGCYIITNYTDGGIGGYKTQSNWDTTNFSTDYWIVKFCETFQANFTAMPNLCPGTCASFQNLSVNATSYQWSFPGAFPSSSTATNPTNICYANPGSYDVQLIAYNANGSDTLLRTNYITVYPSPPPQSITQNGDTLFAIAGSASYQWYFNGNIINGATNYFYIAPASGDYNVVATDANGCEVEAAIFNVIANILGTEDSGLWTVFPNPVEGKFTMHNSQFTIGTALEVSVFNVMGEKMEIEIQSGTNNNSSYEIDVHTLPPGLYYIEIASSEKTFRSKFVKQ